MLNLKKLIASIAAITVALSTVSFAATYTDVAEDSAYYEAVESLSKLGIVTGYDGEYRPEDTVTRAEMAALIARIQGYGETASSQSATVFTDVPASHWASGYIAQASNQGIVNGYGDGTFGPEDPVLYEQAVKMIMATLGYTPFAENNGSYPTGYLAAASRYNVNKGVSNATIGAGANRGTVAQLLSNAIDTPIMGQSKWSTDGTIEYTIYDGVSAVYKTLMSENLGVVKLKGIVEANTVTSINGALNIDTTELPEVAIDITGNFDTNNKDFAPVYSGSTVTGYTHNGEFLVGESDAEDYVGKAVIFYVVENEIEDKYEIISIAEDSTKNDTLTFTLDQFDVVEADGHGDYTTLKYYKNATDKTSSKVAIDAGIDIVYNNEGLASTTINTILSTASTPAVVAKNGACKFGGQVTLIDNDGYSGYDIAFIEVATTAVVKKVTEDGVAFKKGVNLPVGGDLSEIEIDADDENKVIVFVKDGEVIDYTSLVEWDVLSIIADANNANYIYVDVIGTPVVGVVGSTFNSNTSAGGVGYTIDGTKYDVAEGAYKATGVEVGEGGTFYIDKYGKIAAFNEDTALATGVAGNYGYVTKAIVESDAIDGKTVTVQMVTADGIVVADLASSVTFKTASNASATIKPETAVVTSPATATSPETDADTFFGTALKGQVIKYTKNANDKINTITLTNHDEKFETETAASGIFDADNNKIGTMYVDADAVIYFVDFEKDALGNDTTDYDTDVCVVGGVADLDDKSSYTVLAAYADHKAIDSNIIVIKGGLTSASPTTGVAVIKGVAESEVNGDKIYSLTYTIGGEDFEADTIAVTDLTTNYGASAPTVGDVVKIKLNSAGAISGLSYIWNFSSDVRTAASAVSFTYDYDITSSAITNVGGSSTTVGEYFDAGYATAYKETSEQITLNSGNTYKLSQADNVYVIDAAGRNVTVKNGSSASYKYFENLYSTTHAATVKVNNTPVASNLINGSGTWTTAVATYTDYVFVRLYDGKVKDVVIVKNISDVSVSVGTELVTVSFDITGFTGTAPAAQTILAGGTITLPDATTLVLTADGTTPGVGWSTDGTAGNAVDGTETYSANATLYAY